MLEELKKQVYEANMELPRRGLITGSWLSDRRRGRIEASERGRDEGASGELLHKR